MINVPLMRKVLEHITEHPEEHDQNVWAQKTTCGTTLCLAGHVAQMTGHKFIWNKEGEADMAVLDTDHVPISCVAAAELGLNVDQEHDFFWRATDIEELWEIANEATKGEIEIPKQFQYEESI